MHRQRPVGSIGIENIEAGIAGALCRLAVSLNDNSDFILVCLMGVTLQCAVGHQRADANRCNARIQIAGFLGTMPELYPGQGVMGMSGIAHMAQIYHIAMIPEAGNGGRLGIGFRVYRAGLGANNSPATFRLGTAMRRLNTGALRSGTEAMRHLIEAILHDLRPDLQGLEQRVKFCFTRHGNILAKELVGI